MTAATTDLCVGAGGPNSGLYASMEDTLATESSLQPSNPSIRIFKMQRIAVCPLDGVMCQQPKPMCQQMVPVKTR